MTYVTSPGNWLVVAVSILIVALCVLAHYEVLSACNRYLPVLSRAATVACSS